MRGTWRAKVAAACCATGLLTGTARAEWKIPDWEKVQHPGAQEAPASSPKTYTDKAGFIVRSSGIVEGLADSNFSSWREGAFSKSAESTKYILGAAMAVLIKDPDQLRVRSYINDPVGQTDQFHTVAVSWARYIPAFGEAFPQDARERFSEAAAKYDAYLNPSGTESNKLMWTTSANVLPSQIIGTKFARTTIEQAQRRAKDELQKYVKGLYTAGQGEWDSSGQQIFNINGMLNVYDFAPDPDCKLLAKAALDWYAATYALKYTDGIYCGPAFRGMAGSYTDSATDSVGFLWWGGSANITPAHARTFNYAMHAVTSGWRPPEVICNIAHKTLPALPAEIKSSKPNYWHGLNVAPVAGKFHETVYISRNYTMGSLWDGAGEQITRFQLVASSPKGGISFTGGHPSEYKIGAGAGHYDQSAQFGGTYICMSDIPPREKVIARVQDQSRRYTLREVERETPQYDVFLLAPAASAPMNKNGWFFIQADKTFLALKSLGPNAVLGESELSPEEAAAPEDSRNPTYPVIRFEGARTGFILETGDVSKYENLAAFAATVQAKTVLDASKYAENMNIRYQSLSGARINMTYQKGRKNAQAEIDGKALDFSNWPIYGGPYVTQTPGVLTVNDGVNGFVVDFTGDLPVYKPWSH